MLRREFFLPRWGGRPPYAQSSTLGPSTASVVALFGLADQPRERRPEPTSRAGHAEGSGRGSRLFFGASRKGQSRYRGQGLKKVRDDHLGSLSIDLVALAKCTAEQFLLGAGAPGRGRDDPRQRNKESRPAAEGERFAHGEQCKAHIDGVSHEPIRAACNEAGALICFGREAPSGTKLGMADDDEGGAR